MIYLLPLLAGVAVATQIGMNNVLNTYIPNPWVIFFSHMTGALIAVALIGSAALAGVGGAYLDLGTLKSAPWYAYLGGACGVVIVSSIVTSTRSIPICTVLVLLIVGELLTSITFERFSLFGLIRREIDMGRVVGIALICLGTYLVKR